MNENGDVCCGDDTETNSGDKGGDGDESCGDGRGWTIDTVQNPKSRFISVPMQLSSVNHHHIQNYE